jgi:hypothetical protein
VNRVQAVEGDVVKITEQAARRALWAVTAVWMVLQVALAEPSSIATHWRQAETQSMALNLAHRHFNPLMPQINWGGDGPGYVEAELPLYQAVVASLLLVSHDSEWAGLLVSLICIALVAQVTFSMTFRRFGPMPALIAASYVLTSRLGVHLSIAVMPDSMCALLYLFALERFLVWLDHRSPRVLWWSAVSLGLAGCIKPTALGLGIAEFGIVVLCCIEELKKPRLWVTWIVTVMLTGAYLAHAAELHAIYGNTFGIVSGGDSKFPELADVLSKDNLYNLARVDFDWGMGRVPFTLGLLMLVRRKWSPLEWCLGISNLTILFVSMRYTVLDYAGGHYHVFAMLFAAWLLAHSLHVLARDFEARRAPLMRGIYAAAGILLAAQYGHSAVRRRIEDQMHQPSPIVELSRALRARVKQGDLVVMQSDEDAWDPHWRRTDNYQDPRGFYVSGTRGWVLARDRAESALLAEYALRGAHYYVVAGETPESLRPWLLTHAQVSHSDQFGTIYELSPPIISLGNPR